MALRNAHEHLFESHLTWTGARSGGTTGYEAYSREVRIEAPGKPPLTMSGAAAFRGDASLHNPEDLLVFALSSCHCLSYLALAARARLVVLGYEDQTSGVMTLVEGKIRFREVTIRPRVWVAPGSDLEFAKQLHQKAHSECFIANSVNFPVANEPVILVRE